MWVAWCATEGKIRGILMLYVPDAQLFIAQRSKTILNHDPSRLPRAALDALFAASSADGWA